MVYVPPKLMTYLRFWNEDQFWNEDPGSGYERMDFSG